MYVCRQVGRSVCMHACLHSARLSLGQSVRLSIPLSVVCKPPKPETLTPQPRDWGGYYTIVKIRNPKIV